MRMMLGLDFKDPILLVPVLSLGADYTYRSQEDPGNEDYTTAIARTGDPEPPVIFRGSAIK